MLFPLVINEIKFSAKNRSLWLWMAVVLILSSLSVGFGLAEVKAQHTVIQQLIKADEQERIAESANINDWGSAAYYIFNLTYDQPSTFAFAAIGQRDVQPWKHRIRMLALEGQIYERDVGNPSVALIGRFDFSFLAAFVFPLVLIMLLYDLKDSERRAGRYNLIESTVRHSKFLWLLRISLPSIAVYLCLILPMIVVGILAGTTSFILLTVCFILLAYTVFWSLLCYLLSAWRQPGSVILMSLIGFWLLTAVVIPSGARITVDRLVPLPSGADILLLQRESVNDAWDLPRGVTMDEFFKRHPEWSNYQPIGSSFEWPWYYAFQQVGDQKAEALANDYRNGKLKRDSLAAKVSLLAPPSLLERTLQGIAKTDLRASIAYEQKVREYHKELRMFYYPKFYRNIAFDKNELEKLPPFSAELNNNL